MHGLKSGKTLKVLRGHGSYVNHVTFTADQQHVLSASSDGCVKLWDLGTSSCVRTLQPARAASSFAEIQVISAERLVQNPEWLFVVARLDRAFVMTMQGGLVFTLHAENEKVQFIAGCQSPHVGERSGVNGRENICIAWGMTGIGIAFRVRTENWWRNARLRIMSCWEWCIIRTATRCWCIRRREKSRVGEPKRSRWVEGCMNGWMDQRICLLTSQLFPFPFLYKPIPTQIDELLQRKPFEFPSFLHSAFQIHFKPTINPSSR